MLKKPKGGNKGIAGEQTAGVTTMMGATTQGTVATRMTTPAGRISTSVMATVGVRNFIGFHASVPRPSPVKHHKVKTRQKEKM